MAGTAQIIGASNGNAPQSAGNDGSTLSVSINSPKPTFRYTAVDITPVATATDRISRAWSQASNWVDGRWNLYRRRKSFRGRKCYTDPGLVADTT